MLKQLTRFAVISGLIFSTAVSSHLPLLAEEEGTEAAPAEVSEEPEEVVEEIEETEDVLTESEAETEEAETGEETVSEVPEPEAEVQLQEGQNGAVITGEIIFRNGEAAVFENPYTLTLVDITDFRNQKEIQNTEIAPGTNTFRFTDVPDGTYVTKGSFARGTDVLNIGWNGNEYAVVKDGQDVEYKGARASWAYGQNDGPRSAVTFFKKGQDVQSFKVYGPITYGVEIHYLGGPEHSLVRKVNSFDILTNEKGTFVGLRKNFIESISAGGYVMVIDYPRGLESQTFYVEDSDGNNVFVNQDDKSYWYEDGVKQGTEDDQKGVMGDGTVRGREIYDPVTNEWYWLDSVYDGAKAVGKEVWMPYMYQQEGDWDEEKIAANAAASGDMAQFVLDSINNKQGKWVRYDENGAMLKGWVTIEEGSELAKVYEDQVGNTYYYDQKTGAMAKGWLTIDGKQCHFDEITGKQDR